MGLIAREQRESGRGWGRREQQGGRVWRGYGSPCTECCTPVRREPDLDPSGRSSYHCLSLRKLRLAVETQALLAQPRVLTHGHTHPMSPQAIKIPHSPWRFWAHSTQWQQWARGVGPRNSCVSPVIAHSGRQNEGLGALTAGPCGPCIMQKSHAQQGAARGMCSLLLVPAMSRPKSCTGMKGPSLQ